MDDQQNEIDVVINKFQQIDPQPFEELISDIWHYYGYNTETTSISNDRGIDVIATRQFPYEERILIQAKRYGPGSTVSGPEMQKYGSLSRREKVDIVIVISTGGFTKQAKELSEDFNIKCIDGVTLAQIIIEEDLVDLVNSYVNNTMNVEIPRQRSPDEPEITSHQKLQTTIGEGQYLKIEITGYEHQKIPNKRNETVGCMIIAFDVTNKSSAGWKFRINKDLSVIDTNGYSYDNPRTDVCNIEPWSPVESRYTRIRRNTTARIAIFYETPEPFVPQGIEYEGELLHVHADVRYDHDLAYDIERITVPIDESIQNKINSLPKSFPLNSVYIRD